MPTHRDIKRRQFIEFLSLKYKKNVKFWKKIPKKCEKFEKRCFKNF